MYKRNQFYEFSEVSDFDPLKMEHVSLTGVVQHFCAARTYCSAMCGTVICLYQSLANSSGRGRV